MAEYYPLLAKAVGSLPNSTPDTRRVVYERARKALIGQLRTLHPPVPEADIERESVALDRAIERLEAELARNATPGSEATPAAPTPAAPQPPLRPIPGAPRPAPRMPAAPQAEAQTPGAPAIPPPPKNGTPSNGTSSNGVTPNGAPDSGASDNGASVGGPPAKAERKPLFPLRAKEPGKEAAPPAGPDVPLSPPRPKAPPTAASEPPLLAAEPVLDADDKRVRPPRDPQRPIAPQPPEDRSTFRRLWVVPVAVGAVVLVVAYAAWRLRDNPETIAKNKPPEQAAPADTGKIAERVGAPSNGGGAPAKPATAPATGTSDTPANRPATDAQPTQTTQAGVTPAPSNPAVAVAHRAALLVEAPDEPNKVKTFIGTVVWKLNNVTQGPNDAVGLAVEADVEIPDDKLKAVVTFAKNTEASLTASHTINVRYMVDAGSYSGNVKQISVPQMRAEASATGEPLAGVTVPIVQNSFLVGLSPGNAEAANTDLMRRMQWVDIPMLLDSGKIAKLTFEKGDSGQRDINEALEAWAKAN